MKPEDKELLGKVHDWLGEGEQAETRMALIMAALDETGDLKEAFALAQQVGQKAGEKGIKGSYFGECERDDEGHCLPSGQAGGEGGEEQEKPKEDNKPENPTKFSEAEVEKAKESLAKLPSAEEGYRTFKNEIDQVRMASVGFRPPDEKTGGSMKLFGNMKENIEKIGTEMDLDPSEMYYAQSSVTRDGVAKKLTQFEDPEFLSLGLPLVVLENGLYFLQIGNHRAAAMALARGKVTAIVIEVTGRDRKGRPTYGKPGGAAKQKVKPSPFRKREKDI